MAIRNFRIKPVDIPPEKWSDQDISKAFQIVNQLILVVYNPGDLVAASLRFIDIAENGYGLANGQVYVDANGFLKVVREEDVFAPSFLGRCRMGTVTVSV